MHSEDNSGISSPVEGKGDEMLPDRGLPFEGVEEDSIEGETIANSETGQPRDLTPEDLESIENELDFEHDDTVELDATSPANEDAGMSAVYPILRDSDLSEEVGIPEVTVPIPEMSRAPGTPAFGETVFSEPGFSSGMARGGSAHLPASQELVRRFVTKERLQRIWDKIDLLQHDVRNKIPSIKIARELLDQLERARNELMESIDNYEEAERAISGVELRIAISERAERDQPVAMALFGYILLWAISFIWLLLSFDKIYAITGISNDPDIFVGIVSAIFGGLGGIIGALYALYKHAAKDLDFSRRFLLWYISNPISAIFLGVFVFLVIKAGLLSMSVGNSGEDISTPYVIYALAFIVGYQQNVAFDLMRRILKVFQLSDGASKSDGVSNAGI